MSTTTNLTTLKINYLTQAQYDDALANNQINEDEIYLTPQSGSAAETDPIFSASPAASITATDITNWNGKTTNTITLNGTQTASPSFYAPTGAGTSGQYLKSNGSGAPAWTNFPSIPSAGTTAADVGTSSSGGSATTWSKSDHVHKISSGTITTALGYTPCDSARIKSASNIVNTEYNTASERNKLADMSWLSFWNGNWNGTSSNLLAQKVAYITAQGTSGDWRYRVWSNNFIEVWFNGSVTFSSAGSSLQGWYRSVVNVTIPTAVRNITGAFADTANVQVTGAYNAHIFTSGGIKSSGTAFEAQILGGNALAANTTVSGWSVYISGYKR